MKLFIFKKKKLWDYSSLTTLLFSVKFIRYSSNILLIIGLMFLTTGILFGLFFVPTYIDLSDVHYIIIFIHVPAAWISMLLYVLLCIVSIFYLITKDLFLGFVNKSFCLSGILFTTVTLLSGSFWGKPTWGTFWIWDARLTSVLILLLTYISIYFLLSLSSKVNNVDVHQANNVSSIYILFGGLNLPLVKYSVIWWNSLHQPSTINIRDNVVEFNLFVLISLLLVFCSMVCFCLYYFHYNLAYIYYVLKEYNTLLILEGKSNYNENVVLRTSTQLIKDNYVNSLLLNKLFNYFLNNLYKIKFSTFINLFRNSIIYLFFLNIFYFCVYDFFKKNYLNLCFNLNNFIMDFLLGSYSWEKLILQWTTPLNKCIESHLIFKHIKIKLATYSLFNSKNVCLFKLKIVLLIFLFYKDIILQNRLLKLVNILTSKVNIKLFLKYFKIVLVYRWFVIVSKKGYSFKKFNILYLYIKLLSLLKY